MDKANHYDAIVIGGGPAGSTAAAVLAEKGRRLFATIAALALVNLGLAALIAEKLALKPSAFPTLKLTALVAPFAPRFVADRV